MAEPFQVAVDEAGRIDHYVPDRFREQSLSPEAIGEYLNGDEQLTLGAVKYILTEKGSLIHPSVDVIPTVELGFGVRLDRGVIFHDSRDTLPNPAHRIEIQGRTRIDGTEINDGVFIGKHVVMRAALLGAGTRVGEHTRVGVNVVTQPRAIIEGAVRVVLIGESVKIGEGSAISAGAHIKSGAHLGPATTVWPNETVGHNARVGVNSGTDYNGINRGGTLVYDGKAAQDNAELN